MKDENITIRVDEAWLRRLDKWRSLQEFPVSRAAVIRAAVDRLIQEGGGMKTLDQHNHEVFERKAEMTRRFVGNGIACPQCGNELTDVPGISLPTDPPQTLTECANCDYRGTRF